MDEVKKLKDASAKVSAPPADFTPSGASCNERNECICVCIRMEQIASQQEKLEAELGRVDAACKSLQGLSPSVKT